MNFGFIILFFDYYKYVNEEDIELTGGDKKMVKNKIENMYVFLNSDCMNFDTIIATENEENAIEQLKQHGQNHTLCKLVEIASTTLQVNKPVKKTNPKRRR